MRIKEDDKWKIAFYTRYSYFKYQIMFFRLSNVLASFQGYINKILAKKFNLFIIIYLDNIFIYIENSGQNHIKTVKWVLNVLSKHEFFANLKKCQFH